MTILSRSFNQWVVWAVMLTAICGCAHEPFDPPETDEIPKGPGLFTKEQGNVVLYDSKKRKTEPAPDQASPSPGEARQSAPALSPEAYEDFEAYRQWLEWKSSPAHSEEYKEFKQWQEWRRYQDWKKKK